MNFGLDLVMKAFAMGVMFFFYSFRLIDFDMGTWYYWVFVSWQQILHIISTIM
jgi:hypothetical protein